MPVGMRQFIYALHEAIEGESICGNMSKEAVNKFTKKLSDFVGLKLDGLQEIVQEMTDEREEGVQIRYKLKI